MKKYFLSLMILMLSFCLFGCGGSKEPKVTMIKAPNTAETYVGNDWLTASGEFEEAGFTNVTTEELKDIDGDSTVADGSVESITVDGSSEYSVDTEYASDVPVVITYHALAEFKANIHVNFESNLLLSRYDVDFNVDELNEGTMEHGEDADYELTLTYGKHTLAFVNTEDDEVKGEVKLDVNCDLDASYSISCKGDKVNVELDYVDYKEEVPEGEVKVTKSAIDLSGANYEAVVIDLTDMGFTNVKVKPLYDIIFGVTEDGELDSIDIDGNTEFKKGEIFASDAAIVVKYHTLEENDPEVIAQNEKEAEEEASAEKEAAEEEEEESKVLVYVKENQEYNVYYVIDLENKTALYGTSDDEKPSKGVFTEGDNLNDGIDITFYQGTDSEYTERVHWHYENQDSTLILIDANGFDWKFSKTSRSLLPDSFK